MPSATLSICSSQAMISPASSSRLRLVVPCRADAVGALGSVGRPAKDAADWWAARAIVTISCDCRHAALSSSGYSSSSSSISRSGGNTSASPSKAIALLSDPASEVIARGLLALAGRRPDLSDLQRYELFLAGRLHLVRKGDFIVQPTRQGISFTWIDLVAPVRIPPADAPARGQPDPQGDTPGVPDGPAGSPSLSDNPSAVDTLARTVRRGPGDLPGGLTWGKIEGAYRRLAAETTGFRYRRPRPDEPSRPEVAAALNVSPATLKRACEAAGVGSHWPPIRL